MSFAFALMLFAAPDFGLDPAWKPVADPLAPARAGKIQCLDPDAEARTCRGMAWVDVRADGGAQVRQILVLPNMPAYAAESRFRLVREGAALCGVFDATHLADYRIVSSRAPYAPVRDQRLTLIFRETLVATMLNRKICSYHYTRTGDAIGQEVGTIDGAFAGELMSLYSWIDPGAGWRLKA